MTSKFSVFISRAISVALQEPSHPYGVGANLKVIVEFTSPFPTSLRDLEGLVASELAHWDHKHLGLDVAKKGSVPSSFSAVQMIEELLVRFQKVGACSVQLKKSDGGGLRLAGEGCADA